MPAKNFTVGQSNYIKLVAMAAMFIDHLGLLAFPNITLFRFIGRLAFPLFAYQIGIGFLHTGNIMKYFLRLFLFGVVIQLFYIFGAQFFSLNENIYYLNIFFTLALGLLAIMLYSKKKYIPLALVISLPVIANYAGLTFDYGWYGVCVILMLFILRQKLFYMAAGLFILSYFYLLTGAVGVLQLACVIGVLFIAFPLTVPFKIPGIAVYIFYPAHFVIVYIIAMLVN